MPTNVELAKMVADMQQRLDAETERTTEAVFGRLLLKMQTSGVDILELKKQVDELVSSLEHMNSLVEDLRSENASLVADNKALRSENSALTEKVADLEQYSRMNNVEIKGVPCTQGEDCVAIMQTIGEKIECPLEPLDIDVVHRVPTRLENRKNIIARFCSRAKKSEFISQARKAKLCLSDIGVLASPDTPVYINDHLTPGNKTLFAKALTLKKEKKWMFLWTDNCQIKARKTTDSKVLRIRKESDLSKIA